MGIVADVSRAMTLRTVNLCWATRNAARLYGDLAARMKECAIRLRTLPQVGICIAGDR